MYVTSIDEITCHSLPGKLYLGSASSVLYVTKYDINTIISLADPQHIKEVEDHYKFMVSDTEEKETCEQMHEILMKTNSIIREKLQQGKNVLVHCRAGISRSATVVISFICDFMGYSYRQGYLLVQKNRNVIEPNAGFEALLKQLY